MLVGFPRVKVVAVPLPMFKNLNVNMRLEFGRGSPWFSLRFGCKNASVQTKVGKFHINFEQSPSNILGKKILATPWGFLLHSLSMAAPEAERFWRVRARVAMLHMAWRRGAI